MLYLLSPTSSHFKSLQEIADHCGLTRACLSQSLVKLREQVGLPFALGGKPGYSQSSYRGLSFPVHLCGSPFSNPNAHERLWLLIKSPLCHLSAEKIACTTY